MSTFTLVHHTDPDIQFSYPEDWNQALAQVLKEAVEKQGDIGALSTLKSYEKWRRSENLAILGFTDFLDRLFSNNWPPIVVIRRLGLAMMRGFPPLKLFALQLMTGLKGRIPQLARTC